MGAPEQLQARICCPAATSMARRLRRPVSGSGEACTFEVFAKMRGGHPDVGDDGAALQTGVDDNDPGEKGASR